MAGYTSSVSREPGSSTEQALVWFSTLTLDDRRSNYIYCDVDSSGAWHERPCSVASGLPVGHGNHAQYASINGFSGKRRITDQCRQINALFFDIDIHGGEDLPSAVEGKVASVAEAVCKAVSSGLLPSPTMTVDSGRGLHLYYVLERSSSYRTRSGNRNTAGIRLIERANRGIQDRLVRAVASLPYADVDPRTHDFARVARIPGSWNSAANRQCRLVDAGGPLWDLKQLALRFGEAQKHVPHLPRPLSSRRADGARTQKRRLREIRDLQRLRGYDCQGSRENMLFVFYNTATQIYGPG